MVHFPHRRSILILMLLASALMLAGLAAAQGDESGIQVGVVVQGPDGTPQTFCVTLEGDEPTGFDAVRATGLDLISEQSSMGETICRLDSVGCTPPGDPCFCQCMGGSACAYWSYFHLGDAGNWQYSVVSAGIYKLEDGDVEGWWWRDSANTDAAQLPPITFDDICAPDPVFPRTVIDGLGREVVLPAAPQRVASVTLGSDEILMDLIGPERLIGVSYFADDPGISNVSDRLDGIEHTDLSGDPEQLISLDADLVILASYSNAAALDQLEDAQVPVLVLTEFNTIDELRTNIRLLGAATGENTRAEGLITQMDARLQAVQDAVAEQPPVRVLYYEPGGVTYGPGSTVDEIIQLAGGVNVVGEADLGPYPLIDPEFVLAADPDVVLVSGWFADEGDPVGWFSSDVAFGTLRAVAEGRVYAISAAHMTNVSQYIATGVEDVAYVLYPDAFTTPTTDDIEDSAHDQAG